AGTRPVDQPVTGSDTGSVTGGDGTRSSPIKATTAADIQRAQPIEPVSDAQAQAENYKHAHVELPHLGLTGAHSISIETGVGQERKGTGPDGKPWSISMEHGAYGRIKGTKGADGQPLDVFVGPHPSSTYAFIIDQHHPGKGFDEHKIMLGYRTPLDALHAYAHSYDDAGRDRIGGVTAMSPEQFKAWAFSGDTTKPLTNNKLVSSQEVIPPSRVQAEPTQDHHDQIEAVLGKDYDHVLPVDITRAAEILAENANMSPADAFGQAVIENAVEQGFITHEQAVEAYGPEVEAVLEPAGEGASGGGAHVEQERAAPDEVGTGDAEEAGVVPGGSETGVTGEGERTGESGERQDGEQHDAAGVEPDTTGKTGDTAVEAGAEAAGEADKPTVENGGVDDRFAKNREAAANFKKGDKVEFDQPGTFKQKDGTTKEGRLIEGVIKGVASKEQGTFTVVEPSGADWNVGAAKLRKAVAADKILSEAFEQHFGSGKGFKGILEARKFAKERGFGDDPKAIEESMELAIVRAARSMIDGAASPKAAYRLLVDLYSTQPRLGTRTSTSVRDQAYSTPVPLAYLAAHLAGITHETTVYEPTAGNGALLLTADPKKTTVNEINPERAKNLREQGFAPMSYDAVTDTPVNQIDVKGVDRVIANPPFGPVKDASGASTVFDLRAETGVPYQTKEIDHAIALKALEAMKDDGRAVLILGGVNKMVTSTEGRADAYSGKSKREFYKALFDNYNVTDMFTVSGDLYERQGAGWPVDVIVINGRGKSGRPLPAVEPPRIYNDWTSLGGLLNGQQATGSVQPAVEPAARTAETGQGLEGTGAGDRGRAGGDRSGVVEPGSVRGEPGTEAAGAGEGSGQSRNGTKGLGQGVEPAGPREQSPAVDDFDAAFDAALDDAFGQKDTEAERGSDNALKDKAEGITRRRGGSQKERDAYDRTATELAKDTGKAAVDAADEAFTALHKLFGGTKASSGFTFDEDTYKKAKPHFEAAAGKFAEFKSNLGELLRRMVAHMRDTLRWSREVFENIKPYLKRFIDDMRDVAPERKKAIKAAPTETENQVVYKPASTVNGLSTLAPVNMAKPMADSLAALEERVGPIDAFVATELGYTGKQVEKYFGAEQVDALGLAIDNIKRGKGFIIGDQTGIGKGRVNAAIIRWAIKNDRVPVFVTEKPNLYKDMFRDLMDIGITDNFLTDKPRVLATNAALNLPLEEGNGATIKTEDAKKHNVHMLSLLDGDAFGKKYDMVFTTYNQMQTQKGEDTARRQFLSRLADRKNGIVMIIDEAHNAGGQKVAGRGKEVGEPQGRAQFSRDMIQKANGVFYSSATYAKRPDVMDLYAATDMSMAVDNISDLAEAIQRGGIPMQQAVASMLAKAGQYVRRERSFAGINYNTPSISVNRENYNKISSALASIQDLSKYTAASSVKMTQELRAEGGAMGHDASTGEAGASSTNFTAVMHNVINQMLLAMKAGQAATRAIEAIKRGEKPVLTVANTMEAFLNDYADNLGISPGDEMPGDFSHVLMKYLDRTRTVLIKKAHREKGEKPIRHYLSDSELGQHGVMVYNTAKQLIKDTDLSDLPISPIDYMKRMLKKAGYDTGEVTGRTLAVDYTGKIPVLTSRPGSEKTPRGRTKTIEQFNTRPTKGGVHALIINQAGSTGLSAHASEHFNDQSKRRMLIVQPEANIDTHMQLLGR
ncbi:strawberry notch-like NTP hydrolase domain-containing protein, partial [Sphingomonas sp.]|uniref:strawberry notch-like NTP hydrolase domain-containing protein n=1 Tax=Sphingomonas sp. TaxID=28214 RepID=UPI0025F401BE